MRHPVEQAIVAFAARSLARSRPHRLLVAAYCGLGLAFVIGSFLSPVTGIAENAVSESLSTPSVRLLSIPFVLSFFILVALRVLFTVPTEIDANRVFRMTEDRRQGRVPQRVAKSDVAARRAADRRRDAAGLRLALGTRPGARTHRVLAPDGRWAYRAAAVPVPQGAVRVRLRAGQGEREVPVAGVRLVLTAYGYWTARLEL